jgi:hypothetical protein
VGCFFLDSGAHSIYTREVIKKGHKSGYAFYESKEFWEYVDLYCEWVKQNLSHLDFYANVDAIFNPDKSWEVLQYMKKEHGLNPVPVIHYGTTLDVVDKHLDAGYKFLGIGGLGQEVTKQQYYTWADRLFAHLCPDSTGNLPMVRTHGFAMTSWSLMKRYPWWSVDSTSWLKSGSFGSIYVPHKRDGRFTFDVDPYAIATSGVNGNVKVRGKHILTLSKAERQVVDEWLALSGVPLGSIDKKGNMIEYGVISHSRARARANLFFFQMLQDFLPKYPWAFKIKVNKGFGL